MMIRTSETRSLDQTCDELVIEVAFPSGRRCKIALREGAVPDVPASIIVYQRHGRIVVATDDKA